MKNHNNISIIVIISVIVIFFNQFFLHGLLPIPSDTIIGLYHPFRDFYSSQYPNGIPYKNFLVTDPVRQQYPWRFLAIALEKQFRLPLWNPYAFSGTPLLANQQSVAFYPLNILFFIFPFSFSWTILIIAEPLFAGVFLFLYLKNLKLHNAASLLGALSFAFSGFFVSWMEWGTLIHVVLWLPLLLLSVDKLLDISASKKIFWSAIFLFSLVSSFLAGHVQIFLYLVAVLTPYTVAKWVQKEMKKESLLLLAALFLLFVGLTAFQWIPFWQFLTLSARNIDQANWQQPGWFIPWQHLIQFIVPDFFGNPTTLNYWGVWNYAEMVGYIGSAPLLMGLFALFFRRDKKTFFFGSIFFLSLLFSLPTFLAKIPYQFSIPFLSTSQPTRLLFLTDFSLSILGGLGFDYFLKQKKGFIYPSVFLILCFLCLWTAILFNPKIHLLSVENNFVAQRNLVVPTIFVATVLTLFAIIYFVKKFTAVLSICIILLTIAELFRFGWKFTPFTDSHYLFPNTAVIAYLKKNTGINRIMTTDDRILPPNFSIVYSLQSIEGYDPLYMLRYGELIAASQRGKPEISGPFGFNRIITPHTYDSKIINLLGVKYILSLSAIHANGYQKVFQEGQTQVYENKHRLKRVFFTENLIPVNNNLQAIKTIFDTKTDLSRKAIVTCSSCNEIHIGKKYGNGSILSLRYSPDEITITVTVSEESFLVLTDTYYPTWHVSVDGSESKMYLTDYNFRGVLIPKGGHIIHFSDRLF